MWYKKERILAYLQRCECVCVLYERGDRDGEQERAMKIEGTLYRGEDRSCEGRRGDDRAGDRSRDIKDIGAQGNGGGRARDLLEELDGKKEARIST